MLRPIYIAVLFEEEYYLRGINDTIELIYSQFPLNTLVIEKYIISNNPSEVKLVLQDFITKYPTGERCTISLLTSTLIECSNFFIEQQLNIPSFSIGSTSSIVKSLKNVLTLIPYDKYSVMTLFLTFKEFQMNQIKILYKKKINDSIFIQNFIDEVLIQANYLNITVEVDEFIEGRDDYGIKPKTNLIILCNNEDLTNIYITKNFLNLIPPECYIALSEINQNIGDIFSNIPAFVNLPYPLEYDINTKTVYDNLKNKKNYVIGVYALYDILYKLNFFTNLEIPLTIFNFDETNAFVGTISAWGYTDSSIDLKINGTIYGLYMSVFTKDILINNNLDLFLKYNNGGTYNLKDSYSIFRQCGIVPFYSTKVFYDSADYYEIFNECGNLITTRFMTNISSFPSKNKNLQISYGQNLDCKFILRYTQDGYFNLVEPINNLFGSNPQVNINMSKYPVIQYVKN